MYFFKVQGWGVGHGRNQSHCRSRHFETSEQDPDFVYDGKKHVKSKLKTLNLAASARLHHAQSIFSLPHASSTSTHSPHRLPQGGKNH